MGQLLAGDARQPVLGVGPDHWPLIAARYGWPAGKEAHSLWLQIGAEMGFPGIALLLFLLRILCVGSLQLLQVDHNFSSWFAGSARVVIASLAGLRSRHALCRSRAWSSPTMSCSWDRCNEIARAG